MSDKEKEEQRKRVIKISVYLGLFVLAFIILKLNSLTNNNTEEKKQEEKNTIEVVDFIKNLDENNYEENIYLTLDDDAITLNFQKSNDIYIGVKKYHGENITYIKKENIYYSLNQDDKTLNQMNDFVEFNYDKTFTDISIIKKLLEKDITPTHTNNVVSYKYNIKDILPIYNSYNYTTLIDIGSGYITLDIHHENNILNYILIDITTLYNKINNKEYDQVLYKLTFKQTKEEDISWINELLK